MLVAMSVCSQLAPDIAKTSPRMYSLLNAAARSRARYSSGVMRSFCAADMLGLRPHCTASDRPSRKGGKRDSAGRTAPPLVDRWPDGLGLLLPQDVGPGAAVPAVGVGRAAPANAGAKEQAMSQ